MANGIYDFSGWATRNDLKCSDGRTIRKDAFRDDDGTVVPLVWNHQHTEANNVLGHALLENRKDGVYAYCTFNDTDNGRNAKELVRHGDIRSLSIYANQLKQIGQDVIHGAIREVSLVLAGANPGAYIDAILEHADDEGLESAVIYTGEDIEMYHADNEQEDKEEDDEDMANDKTIKDVIDTFNEDQLNVLYYLVGKAQDKSVRHADAGADEAEAIKETVDSMTDEQREALFALLGMAAEDGGDYEEDDGEDDAPMKHNVFEGDNEMNSMTSNALTHSQLKTIIDDGKRYGSLKESFLQHAAEYGIENIDYLYPEDRAINDRPDFIKRETGWVSKVMNSVHHTPFSRIKSVHADITGPQARAKGYVKGHLKLNEVIALLKRSTDPQTVYKKQKLDRDDIIDITDFDVVAWLKSEMRMMLDEEIARAILLGDDRVDGTDDKISEDHIRSVWNDSALYAPKYAITPAQNEPKAKAFIKAVIRNRKDYKGSGNPTLYTTEEMLTEMLLLEDSIGHFLYPNADILATTLRVKEIITVPVMEEITHPREDSVTHKEYLPLGILVNLIDYNVGADKGGAINMFDDFDIDYNQQKYLIETRCSGALTKPYSALVFEEEQVQGDETDPEDDTDDTDGE